MCQDRDVSEWFPVNLGLRQCCMMSSLFFHVYVDDVVLKINTRALGKEL